MAHQARKTQLKQLNTVINKILQTVKIWLLFFSFWQKHGTSESSRVLRLDTLWPRLDRYWYEAKLESDFVFPPMVKGTV